MQILWTFGLQFIIFRLHIRDLAKHLLTPEAHNHLDRNFSWNSDIYHYGVDGNLRQLHNSVPFLPHDIAGGYLTPADQFDGEGAKYPLL